MAKAEIVNYAIVRLLGNQFIIEPNTKYRIKKNLFSSLNFLQNSKQIFFQNILFFSTKNFIKVGKPFINSSVLKLPIQIFQNNAKNKKIVILKTRKKKHYTRKLGYREKLLEFIANYKKLYN